MNTDIHTYRQTDTHTYYIHTYINTHIHTHINQDIHTSIYTYLVLNAIFDESVFFVVVFLITCKGQNKGSYLELRRASPSLCNCTGQKGGAHAEKDMTTKHTS